LRFNSRNPPKQKHQPQPTRQMPRQRLRSISFRPSSLSDLTHRLDFE